MTIANYEQFMDMILELVSATEPDEEIALSAAVTIGSLYNRGFNKLAEEVLLTYKPQGEN
jgi:hypothetical protein